MVGISYEFFYPEGADDGTFCILTYRPIRHSNEKLIFVTDVKENPGKPVAERWSQGFLEAILKGVDWTIDNPAVDPKNIRLETEKDLTLVECVEPKDAGERTYYLITAKGNGTFHREPTTIEQIETLVDDYLGDDFEDATQYG